MTILLGEKKSDSSSTPTDAPNTLRSNMKVNLTVALGEGPIVGLVTNDGRSIFSDGTAIANTDGTLNRKGVSWQFRYGLPDQSSFVGNTISGTPHDVGIEVKVGTGRQIRTVDDLNAQQALVAIQIPALVASNTSNGDTTGTGVMYQVQRRATGGDWVTVETVNIFGKNTSPYFRKSIVQAPGDGQPWDIGILRITADSDVDTLQNKTIWDNYITQVKGRYNFADTACIDLALDSQYYGNSIGDLTFHLRGLIIDVPTNYDPETRAYTGIWDGSFKQAWTNNPAWIYWALITTTRWGLGEFVDDALADKWTLFTIGQYCDQLVPSGFKRADGTEIMEPRFTFNGVINTRAEAYKVLQDVATTFRSMAYWSLSQVVVSCDMPSDPVAAVGPANVVDGAFSYSGTAVKARHSVAICQWNDPQAMYQQAFEVVMDDDQVERFGWREIELTLTGCTSRGQAHRFGKWVLDSEKNETETVQFTMSWDGFVLENNATLQPGNIILVSDPRKNGGFRAFGRTASVASASSLVLDAPFDVGADSYTLGSLLPSGKFETRAITSFGTDHKTITVSPAFSEKPIAGADWVIQGTSMAARTYRIVAVQEDDKHLFKITALFHDPTKYARIEDGVTLQPVQYVRPRNVVNQVTNITTTEYRYFQNGVSHSRVTVGWTPPNDFLVRDFVITADTPRGFVAFAPTSQPTFDINDAVAGQWTIYISARSLAGALSVPVSHTFTVEGWEAVDGPIPDNLRTSEGADTFTTRSVTMLWDNVFPTGAVPYAVENVVRVYKDSTLLRTETVRQPTYTYDIDKNINDGGPRRAFTITVTAKNVTGVESAVASLDVSNPVPAKVVPTVSGGVGFIDVKFSPNSSDYAGCYVWARTNPGYAPVLAEADYVGPDTLITLVNKDTGTWYVWVALYDTFGTDGLLVSDPISLSISSLQATLDAVLPDLIEAAGQVTFDQLDGVSENIADQVAGILNQIVLDRDWNDQLHARNEQTLSVKSDDLSAMVTQEQTARIEADFAEATARQVLEANINTSILAQIATESTARVSADSALTTQINSAVSQINTNTASITSEASTRASADSANATSITALTATVGGNTASITTEATARASADTALSALITALTSTVGTNTASITSEASTRASADSANASSISSLSTTVGGNTSSISTLTSSVNGVKVQFGVIGTINGVTGGFIMTGVQKLDGSVSFALEIQGNLIVDGTIGASKIAANVITANKMVAHTLTANEIATGTITSASGAIGALSVQSLSIGDNAVTVPSVASASSSVTGVSATTFTTVLSVNLSVDTTGLAGKQITVFASLTATMTFSSTPVTHSQLYINGNLIQDALSQLNFVTCAGGYTFTASGGVDTIPVRFDWAGTPNSTLGSRVLYAQAAKR